MSVEAFVNKLLCINNGRMDLEDLCNQISDLASEDEVETVLKDSNMLVLSLWESKMVFAKTELRLCSALDCEGCNNLHLCKLYLFGKCPYLKRQGCHFCHDLYSEHNVNVLCQHNLLELDHSELCVILLQNDPTLLPQVCLSYNKGRGQYGDCSYKEDCRNLHICVNYLRGTCEGSTKCGQSHDFYEPQPMKTLQDNGVPAQMIGSVWQAYQNMLIIQDANAKRINSDTVLSHTQEKNPDICLFYIKNDCKRKDRCLNVHFQMPYKWERRDEHGWKLLPDNEEIERAFCDPAKSCSEGIQPVDFENMTQDGIEVRRLTTPSLVLYPTFILTTTWVWYFEDENENWIQYGSSEGIHNTSITSEELERKHQEDSSAMVDFTAGQHSYELNMQDMLECNKEFRTKRLVRRRPVFLSAEDVQKNKTSKKDNRRQSKALPSHWEMTSMPETGFKRVPLNSTCDEYKKIAELFNQTMSGCTVKNIERVQNQDLWEIFQWQSNVMKRKSEGKDNEKLLFHGTESKHVDEICQQNFDWRLCGVHGTAYGKGSYFARDAKYSHSYTDKFGTRCIFVSRVLVGEYTEGHPNYLRPPRKDGECNIWYDSCVDDLTNPSIFVVFEKHQVYPEYLIEYEVGKTNCPQLGLSIVLSSMTIASLDPTSAHQLSPDTSSGQNVESNHPTLNTLMFRAPLAAPVYHIPQRNACSFVPTQFKTRSRNSDAAYFTSFSNFSFVKQSRAFVRPPGQLKSHKGFEPISSPANLSAYSGSSQSDRRNNTRWQRPNITRSDSRSGPVTTAADKTNNYRNPKPVRFQNPRQQHPRSDSKTCLGASSTKLSTSKTPKSATTQNPKQHPWSEGKTSPGASSTNLSTGKTHASATTQNPKQHPRSYGKTSPGALSTTGKTPKSVRNHNDRQQAGSASGVNPATGKTAAQTSTTKTSKSDRNAHGEPKKGPAHTPQPKTVAPQKGKSVAKTSKKH